MTVELYGRFNPELLAKYPESRFKRQTYDFFRSYLQTWHGLSAAIHPDAPKTGPLLFLSNHTSFLDVPSLIAADPYFPATVPMIREDLFKIPVIGHALKAAETVALGRDGNDMRAVRQLLRLINDGRAICFAPEGTRTRTGHLWPLDQTAVELIIKIASRGVPVCSVAVIGAYEVLPPGAMFPGVSGSIQVRTGQRMDLSEWAGKGLSQGGLYEAAGYIQSQLALLLPPHYQPLPGTPAMWKREQYMALRKMKARSRSEDLGDFQQSIVLTA